MPFQESTGRLAGDNIRARWNLQITLENQQTSGFRATTHFQQCAQTLGK
jgi:hypothetical protein